MNLTNVPPRIQSLPLAIANQIAAGEVIERPASVVKELLENALDAGASVIHIDIHQGGFHQIKVSDNGHGIDADDLPLAIAPHATSKISSIHDLFHITSMGFRGEALASIAAVSRLTIQSKPIHQATATMLTINEQGISQVVCARNQGTTIDVRDLFYNVPVRKKFLKSEHSEYLAIELLVKRFALSVSGIAITLTHNNKVMLKLPSVSDNLTEKDRIRKVFGKSFIENAVYLDVERAGMSLRGWISGPEDQRSQSDKQWVYLNGRMIRDKLILHAIKMAYASVLRPDRHPSCVLYLSVSPTDVDVNVHPTKHEVRFVRARWVHDFFVSSLANALQDVNLIPHRELMDSPYRPPSLVNNYRHWSPQVHESKVSSFAYQKINAAREWTILNPRFVCCQLSDAQNYLIDLRRVFLVRLEERVRGHDFPIPSRPLIVPLKYSLNIKSPEKVEHTMQLLLQWGLHCDVMGNDDVIVRAIPSILPHLDMSELFLRLAKVDLTSESVWPLFMECYVYDARQCSELDIADHIDFLEKRLTQEGIDKRMALVLSESQCQEWFS